MKYLFILAALVLNICSLSAKDKLISFFSKDSVKTGEHIELTLYHEHPSYYAIILPDSSYNYYPFEYIGRRYYPTRSSVGISRDCTVYLLRTFEPLAKLSLALPVTIFTESDTSKVYPAPAEVALRPMVKGTPDPENLKTLVVFTPVPKQINYPQILLVTISSAILIFFLNALFGKPIRRRIRIFTAIFAHRQFLKSYETLEKAYLSKKDVTILEKILGQWKDYLTRLEDKPVSSYTSTEIIAMYGKEDLKNSLQILDKAIFGRILSEDEDKAVKNLKSFSNKRYISRKNEIRRS